MQIQVTIPKEEDIDITKYPKLGELINTLKGLFSITDIDRDYKFSIVGPIDQLAELYEPFKLTEEEKEIIYTKRYRCGNIYLRFVDSSTSCISMDQIYILPEE